ncbi:MAG: hypothetical protein A2945_00695 [Candidatus Liptonbacteria bacterium RIFCSPLOWO2_01_FULL_52_25]|uniref:Uncharacterized protein n=1 Tax=Candidatus Liptonbacteria bacterium RIFCSPLOWO2_01_FULL_52_25 TaxID=1798650 RepID=A0A1G2CD91_9BACT|nr:MAG: hypothetical protein A2945_00695 [Candidatus Liptonbacteria bacterium RIFCSPLOWO2_01_FULL_52_25]
MSLVTPSTVLAASVSVSPVVLDYKAKVRDIIEGTLLVKNLENRMVAIYPVVNNVDPSSGRTEFVEPSSADFSSSLANWISVSRGMIELRAGEERTVPFKIQVNLAAKPGAYHAFISFPVGATRAEAESRFEGAATVAVNVEVQDDIKENLQLLTFAPDKNLFLGGPVSFTYQIENNGNRAEVPQGELVIYDKRGKEIANLVVNKEQHAVAPASSREFSNTWPGSGAFGKYRALLSVRYGADEAARLQDTVFFTVMPWQKLGALALVLLSACMGFAWWIHRRYTRFHHAAGVGHRPSHDPRHGLSSEHFPHVVDLRHPRHKEETRSKE